MVGWLAIECVCGALLELRLDVCWWCGWMWHVMVDIADIGCQDLDGLNVMGHVLLCAVLRFLRWLISGMVCGLGWWNGALLCAPTVGL